VTDNYVPSSGVTISLPLRRSRSLSGLYVQNAIDKPDNLRAPSCLRGKI